MRSLMMAWQVVICTTGLFLTAPAVAMADSARFEITAQPLPAALKAFAAQAHMQLLYQYSAVAHATGNAVVGELETHAALEQLLRNTGLEVIYSSSNAATIRPVKSSIRSSGQEREGTSKDGQGEDPTKDGKKSSSQGFRVAQVDQGASSSSASVERQSQQTSKEQPIRLEEVIVTAQKRNERLQDVPIPVTVISADTLASTNQLRLQDYYASVPGLNFVSSGPGVAQIAIRGVTTAGYFANPTVGITVDDVPYGPSSGEAFAGTTVPDIDPSELAHIEVLRGPQGTLYGAASIGGLIKYVTADPSTANFSGILQGGIDGIHNGNGAGYSVRGAGNVPFSDTLAIRISGDSRREPGYVDDPVLQINGVNKTDTYGGRLSALWTPLPALSVKLSAMVNTVTADGNPDVNLNPGTGELLQSLVRGTGGYDQRLQLYTATFTAKLGSVDLTSISGYQIEKATFVSDSSAVYSSSVFPATQILFGVDGSGTNNRVETRKFTQELRIGSNIGKAINWLLGGFYTHEASDADQAVFAAEPVSGTVAGLVGDFYFPTAFAETSVFANATIHLTHRVDLEFGARESSNRQRYDETDSGPYIPAFVGVPSPHIFPTIHTTDSAFTYSVAPKFQVSQDVMAYARIASGYRPGGPNPGASLFSFPSHFAADKTINYELGLKGDTLAHALSFDASIYYIDWRDIQVTVVDPNSFYSYFTNGSSAKSEGVELAVQAKPLKGLSLSTWVAWNEAVLTSDLPISSGSAIGISGDALPFSSRWSGNASVDQDIPLSSNLTGFVGASVSYIGKRYGTFAGNLSQTRAVLPAYARLDLRAGWRYGGSWSVTGYVNNVADKRGVLNVTLIGADTFYTYITPRTIGLSLSKVF